MASGRTIHDSKPFGFASDDVLSSYNEFSQESPNGAISDPATGNDCSKDFQKSRMTRTYSPNAVCNQPDESLYQETICMVEICMKRHTVNLMRFLEGISSRLSQLELYCYNVDKSVGEMRSNLGRDYEETGLKLNSLEKHLAEVGRSVQILRDKQELAETQKELAKLQLAQKELSSPNAPRNSVEHEQSPSPTSDTSEFQNQHLAIVLRHQGAPQPQSPQTRPVEVPHPAVPSSQFAPQHGTQPQHYYVTSAPFQVQVQASKAQYLTSDYQTSQPLQQDINLVRLQPVPHQVSQAPPHVPQFIQYQQRSQQPQQLLTSTHLSIQQPPTPVQSRPNSAPGYPPHQPTQSIRQVPQETASGSVHMHAPSSNLSPQAVNHADVMPYGYVGRPVQQQPLLHQQIKTNNGAPSNVYTSAGPHQSLSSATYVMYANEEVRRQPPHPSQFPQAGSYPQATVPGQHTRVSMINNPNQPQFARNHNDLIEKFLNMGFRADHVISVIHRIEESGQAADFNTVFNTLNVQSSGLRRGWTG
ncbi:unnamed protein product [Rhodiola kirilowii]